MTPSDGHVLEISKSNANQWINALELCKKRILEGPAEGDLFGADGFRVEVDIHFFLVALLRFYRSTRVAIEKLPYDEALDERVKSFHRYIGIKRTMRNVGEHFDDYAMGAGRDSSINTRNLQVWSMESHPDNVRFTWLGETFDLKRTMEEATVLWKLFLDAFTAHRHGTKEAD